MGQAVPIGHSVKIAKRVREKEYSHIRKKSF